MGFAVIASGRRVGATLASALVAWTLLATAASRPVRADEVNQTEPVRRGFAHYYHLAIGLFPENQIDRNLGQAGFRAKDPDPMLYSGLGTGLQLQRGRWIWELEGEYLFIEDLSNQHSEPAKNAQAWGLSWGGNVGWVVADLPRFRVFPTVGFIHGVRIYEVTAKGGPAVEDTFRSTAVGASIGLSLDYFVGATRSWFLGCRIGYQFSHVTSSRVSNFPYSGPGSADVDLTGPYLRFVLGRGFSSQ